MIGSYLPPVVAQVLADIGKYSAGMGAVKAEMTGLRAATTRLASVGKMAFAGVGIAAAAVGFESVKLAANFDQTMEVIHTQAGAAQSEVEDLKGKVLALAPAVGVGPEKLAEALYHVESTGYRGAQAMDILEQAAKLAAMGMADLDDVTYALSGVMAVGMRDIHNATDAIAFMNATVGMGDMRMDQLARAIGTGVLPSFKTAGLTMADFSAAIATIADNSVPADEAATRLRMTIALMSAPSGEAVKALEAIGLTQLDASHALAKRDKELAGFGITVSQLAKDMQQPNGLLVAVKDLKAHLAGLSAPGAAAVIEKAFGGGRTSGAILTLLQEVDRLESKYDQLGTAEQRTARTEEAWAQQQKQFSQQWHEFTAQVQVWGVKIGEWLIPKIQDLMSFLSRHTEAVKLAAIVIGGVLVAAMVAFTATVVANTIAMLANPVTWIILGIVAAVALLSVGIYELGKHWRQAWGGIKAVAGAVGDWFVALPGRMFGWIKQVPGLVREGIMQAAYWVGYGVGWMHKEILALPGQIWDVLTSLWDGAVHIMAVGIANMVKFFIDLPGQVGDWLKELPGEIKGFFSDAGSWLFQAGKDIIMGLWHGLVDAWHAVSSFFSDIGDSIKSGFSDAMEMHSPSKVFYGYGQNIMEGLELGLKSRSASAVVSVEQIATMGRTAATAALAAATSGGGSGGGGDTVLHARFVLPDGRNYRTETLRYARQSGKSPAAMLPLNTGTLERFQ